MIEDYMDVIDYEKTARIFTEYRLKNKLSIADLARLTGAARSQIYKWELGEALPRVHQLMLMAAVYGVKADDLIATVM